VGLFCKPIKTIIFYPALTKTGLLRFQPVVSAFLLIEKHKKMASWQFKTNINCNNCILTVTNFLNEVEGVESWTVDTTVPDKTLTVVGPATAAQVITAVEEAGFDIEQVES